MNTEKEFYDKIGSIIGWDFSNVKCTSEGVKWNFYEEVTKRANPKDILLDIGTGGGENILNISDKFYLIIGIDMSDGMIETATQNLNKTNVFNVKFLKMEAENIKFPNGFFDIVSNNHSAFCTKEVFRVLNKNGTFLTQQVSEGDKLNIKQYFGRGQSYQIKDGTAKNKYTDQMKDLGFTKVESFEYNATDYFHTAEDLLFLLKHTPIIPDFGNNPKDIEIFNKFVSENATEKGIKTNSKRYMIIAKK